MVIEEKGGILSPTINGVLIIAKGIKVETYLCFKNWMRNSKRGEISDLELLIILSLCRNGKDLPIPCSQFYRNDDKRGEYNHEWDQEEIYWHRILGLIFGQGEGNKEIYRDKFILKEKDEETSTLEDYLSFKKTLLLYDWIKGNKEMKSLEQGYFLYEGDVLRLAEGFCWLADSLAAIAESACWKKKRKEDLKQIILLSERLIEGIEEEGLNLARFYIPGLSRYNIRRLVEAGYRDENSLRDASEVEFGKLLPKRLVQRIQKKLKEENNHQKMLKEKWIVQDEKLKAFKKVPEEGGVSISEQQSITASPVASLKPLLEISQRRSDRIIFLGKEVKITAKGFSLLYFLAQHKQEVVSYDSILDEIWEDEEDAIYTRIISHVYKFRRNILDTIGHNKDNKEKVKDIFKVISRRGIMLNLEEEKLKIS